MGRRLHIGAAAGIIAVRATNTGKGMEPMKYMRWLAACLLAVSMAGTAWAAPSDQLLQEEELDVQSVYTQLLDLSKEELLADTKRAFALAGQGEQSGDEGILVPWTAALAQRLGEFQPEELADEILNGENEESYRAALIQLVEQDGRGADSRLYSMMMDSSQSAYLRGSLALHLPMETQQHRALLEQLATGQDALAEYAAMRLEWLEREGRRGREILLASKTGVLLTEAREADGGELREYLLHAPWEREYTAYIGKACSWDQLRGEVERLLDLMLDNVSCIRGIELAERMEKRRPIPPLSMEGWDSLIESGKERGILHSCMEWLQEGKRNGSLTRACLQLFQHDIEQVLYAALQDCGIQAHQFLYKGNMLNERLEAVHTVSEMENWLRKVLSGTAALLKEAGEPESVTERVKQYVRTSVGKDISRKEVADKMYLNPDYLDRIFKKETGMSVNRFITAEKVSMAKKLLNKGELSVSEVASRCGYTNLSGFSAMFKKETGENPTEYKKHD